MTRGNLIYTLDFNNCESITINEGSVISLVNPNFVFILIENCMQIISSRAKKIWKKARKEITLKLTFCAVTFCEGTFKFCVAPTLVEHKVTYLLVFKIFLKNSLG